MHLVWDCGQSWPMSCTLPKAFHSQYIACEFHYLKIHALVKATTSAAWQLKLHLSARVHLLLRFNLFIFYSSLHDWVGHKGICKVNPLLLNRIIFFQIVFAYQIDFLRHTNYIWPYLPSTQHMEDRSFSKYMV